MQILTLAILAEGDGSSREIHEALERAGRRGTIGATLSVLLDLRMMRFVEGWGHPPIYRVTGEGRATLREVGDFYRDIREAALSNPGGPRALPTLSHLQARILFTLEGQERPGREVRSVLEGWGRRTTDAAFYLVMARLERHGVASGRFTEDGKRERLYKVTEGGRAALREVRTFYHDVGRKVPPRGAAGLE